MQAATNHAGGSGWNDERVERVVGLLLRIGVLISAGVVLAGGILYLIQHGSDPRGYRVFRPGGVAVRGLPAIVRGAWHLDYRSLIQFGLLLLIATPVARVAFCVAAFALERDRTYVVITLIVLAVLLASLIGSQTGV
ncbi:MAG TPA: DUF1634 domain-containing protein [Bryobacteraceae bacterium]|nr:DUF1634 domain-containing protein [Bryobacteraceae bacterium]